MAIRRAVGRFREVGGLPSFPILALALFLIAGPAFGQDRSEAHERDAGERQAVPSEPSPPPSTASEPSPPPSAPSEPAGGGSTGGATDSAEPRTAVPTGPGDHSGRPERQPPTRRDHGGGGHGRGGGVYGGYYDPNDPNAPYGVYGSGAYGSGPGGSGGTGQHTEPGEDVLGALDLDISPGRTQVYLEGEYIGTADDFDGWPRFLWLPEGTYDIVLFLDGYKTLVRQVTVHPRLVIDMDDRMEHGASTRPEDLLTGTGERED